ncbi:McrC family protein [Oceanobacillus sp. CAU 1775]
MEQTFKVPIRNIFCMLSYVNDYPEFVDQLSDVDEEIITYDFLAKRFILEGKKLLRRGVVKNYITQQEETSTISGKMLMNESLPFIVERRPIVVCEKDFYSADIIYNQVMKTTLKGLYQNKYVEEHTRRECYLLWEQLPEVNDIELRREIFLRIRFSRQNAHYKPIIQLARLLHELRLLSHKKGEWSLFSVELSEAEMNGLFENFLFHFYRIEKKEYSVRSERMTWNLEGNKKLLPTMLTDITLSHRKENKRIVMDAKFYKNMFQRFHDKNSFHSGNLYQLFTYLMHQPEDCDLRGILIYPANDQPEISESYEWNERIQMEIYSLDLDASWNGIRSRLLEILVE